MRILFLLFVVLFSLQSYGDEKPVYFKFEVQQAHGLNGKWESPTYKDFTVDFSKGCVVLNVPVKTLEAHDKENLEVWTCPGRYNEEDRILADLNYSDSHNTKLFHSGYMAISRLIDGMSYEFLVPNRAGGVNRVFISIKISC